MNDWCNKINLFSWLTGVSTNSDKELSKTTNREQQERPAAESNHRQPNETDRQLQDQSHETSDSANKYSKNQNTLYFHKASGTKFDAKVVGVHFDDDPDNPYYTIQYTCSDGERVERQTTEDRLSPFWKAFDGARRTRVVVLYEASRCMLGTTATGRSRDPRLFWKQTRRCRIHRTYTYQWCNEQLLHLSCIF